MGWANWEAELAAQVSQLHQKRCKQVKEFLETCNLGEFQEGWYVHDVHSVTGECGEGLVVDLVDYQIPQTGETEETRSKYIGDLAKAIRTLTGCPVIVNRFTVENMWSLGIEDDQVTLEESNDGTQQ